LPIAVFAEEPLVVSQQIGSNEAGLNEFGKVTPLGSLAINADFLMYNAINAKDSTYFYYLDGKIKTAIIMLIYAIAALVFFGVYNHNIKLGLGKKASLNISVEAIIILIFAITMLGLGLGFIRGMFGKVSTQLEQQVAQEPEPSDPNGAIPITLSREQIISNQGQQQVLKVGVYNSGGTDTNISAPYISCLNWGNESHPESPDDLLPDESVNPKIIKSQGKETFVIVFNVPTGTTAGAGVHLCKVGFPNVNPAQFRDFTIKIIQ